MQNLSGNSLGKNNKSSVIFHRESNKIGFAFFWFFYDFVHNLQESAKCTLLFQLQICRQALEKNFLFAMWSSGARSGGPAAIPAGDRRIPAGGQQGNGLGPTRVRFGGVIGDEERPAVGRTGGWRGWPPRLPISSEGRFGGRRERAGEQRWVQGKAVGALAGGFGRPDPMLTVAVSTGADGGSGRWLGA
jgi:hypothetical protein